MNNHTLRRWIDVVLYAILGAIAFELMLPIGWRLSEWLPDLTRYQPWFVAVVGWFGVFVVAYVVSAPIRIRAEH